jgi:hypothetical protein
MPVCTPITLFVFVPSLHLRYLHDVPVHVLGTNQRRPLPVVIYSVNNAKNINGLVLITGVYLSHRVASSFGFHCIVGDVLKAVGRQLERLPQG